MQLVLDGTGAVSMFVVLGAIAGSRDAALVTAALTALVLTSHFRRPAGQTRRAANTMYVVPGPPHPRNRTCSAWIA